MTDTSKKVDPALIAKYKMDNSIQYFEHSGDTGCFVLNKTKTAQGKPTSIIFSINGAAITLPATIAPIDLCKYAPKEDILKSANVITALNRRIIEIISEADALKLLNTKDMRYEMARLAREAEAENSVSTIEEPETNVVPDAAGLNKAITNANIEVVEAIESIKDNGLKAAVERLKELKLYFTDNDIAFIKEKLANEDGGLDAIKEIFD